MAQAEVILSDLSVEVDDQTVTVLGNSITYKDGQGEATVKAASNGRTPVMVVSEDIESKFGMIKFMMPASVTSLNLVTEIKARKFGVVVRITGSDRTGARFGKVLTNAIMVNDPETEIKADGSIELEFQGSSLISV